MEARFKFNDETAEVVYTNITGWEDYKEKGYVTFRDSTGKRHVVLLYYVRNYSSG